MSVSTEAVRTKARRGLSATQKKNLTYWVFLIPFLVGFSLLFFWVYFDSLIYAFSTFKISNAGYTSTLSGFKNFSEVLSDSSSLNFITSLWSSVGSMLLSIPMVTIYSLFIAVILSQKLRGRTVFRAIYFIPVILATGFMTKADMANLISDSLWNNMGVEQTAASTIAGGAFFDQLDIQRYLMRLSFSPALTGYVISAVTGIFDIVNISGVQMLVFLAGLQSISPSIYESANIDGATSWETFWLVTFPMISPIILVNVVYTVIDSFTRTDNPVMILIQEQYYKGANALGTSSAMAWIYFVVVTISLAIVVALFSGLIYYQQRD